MLLSIVELMSGERLPGFRRSVVDKLIALPFGHASGTGLFARRSAWLYPSLAAIIGALNDLAKPAACLRRIYPIRVGGRALQVIHLPARKMRAADIPLLALAIRSKDKCALARSNQHPYSAHFSLLPISCKGRCRSVPLIPIPQKFLVDVTISPAPKPPYRPFLSADRIPQSSARKNLVRRRLGCRRQARILAATCPSNPAFHGAWKHVRDAGKQHTSAPGSSRR